MVNEYEILNQVIQFIEEKLFDENLTVQNAADYVKINSKVLAEIFTRNKLPNPCRYIALRRIEELEKEIIILHKNGEPVKSAHLAKYVGYSSMAHLNNRLNSVLGFSYTELKNIVINNFKSGKQPVFKTKFPRNFI